MLEFAGGVKGININNHRTNSENRSQCDRVLQDIGHHDRNAIAFFNALSLQKSAQRTRAIVEFAIGHGFGKANVGGSVPKARKGLFE